MTIKALTLLFLLLCPLILADNVGVVVQTPNREIYADCVDVSANSDGYEVLQATSFDLVWAGPSSLGHALCRVENIGDDVSGDYCSYDGEYWNFYLSDNTSWDYMPVGFDGGEGCWNGDLESVTGHYCSNDGHVLGLAYGEYNTVPEHYTYQKVCQPLEIYDVKIFLDDVELSGDYEDGGEIAVEPYTTVKFEITLTHAVDFDNLHEVTDVEGTFSGSDFEYDLSFNSLAPRDTETETVEFEVPIDEDDFDADLKIESDFQTIELSYRVKVVTFDYKLSLSANLEKSSVCEGDALRAGYELKNLGTEGQDVKLKLYDSQKVRYEDTFFIGSGDEESDSFMFEAPLNPGNYTLRLKANDQTKEFALEVRQCTTSKPLKQNEQATLQEQGDAFNASLTGPVATTPQSEPSHFTDTLTSKQNGNATNYQDLTYDVPFIQKYGIIILIGFFEVALILVIVYIIRILKK